jgi:hypothetical protein
MLLVWGDGADGNEDSWINRNSIVEEGADDLADLRDLVVRLGYGSD